MNLLVIGWDKNTFHSLVTLGSALGLQRKVLESTKMVEDAIHRLGIVDLVLVPDLAGVNDVG